MNLATGGQLMLGSVFNRKFNNGAGYSVCTMVLKCKYDLFMHLILWVFLYYAMYFIRLFVKELIQIIW
jgi:hypothetical protein